MSQERTEAVVLRGVDFSETSRIVTILCPDRGRVACLAAGVRRAKSPLAAVLDTFNRVEVVYYWKDGREVQRLGEAVLVDGYPAIKSDVEKSVFAAFPLEIAYRVAQQNEPSHRLYAVLVNGLERMAEWTGPAMVHVAWQVMQLLSAAGYEPALDWPGSPAGFAFDHGVVGERGRADRLLSVGVYEDLCLLARQRDRCPEVSDPQAAFNLLRGFAVRQLETEFRSLWVIDQILEARNRPNGGAK